MFPFGSLGGFHFRMIWDEEFDEDIGSKGTEGSKKEQNTPQTRVNGKNMNNFKWEQSQKK